MFICGYGLVKPSHARPIASAVCDVLGHGQRNQAVSMLLETAAQETHLGRLKDPTPNGAGRGLFQMDAIGFKDTKARTKDIDVFRIQHAFGIDIRQTQHFELDHSPLLAAIFCRLFYRLIPAPFPETIIGRADYWKKYYNTEAGKGRPVDYVRNAEIYIA